MNSSQKKRLAFVIVGLIFATVIIIGRLVVFQIVQGDEYANLGASTYRQIETPERGIIYDRNGAVMAVNKPDYRISASPNYVLEPEELATALAPILGVQRYQLLADLQSDNPYVLLASRVSYDVAEAIRALPYDGLQVEPVPRRLYPQGELLCHSLGFVDFEGSGHAGVEGYYQDQLAGEAASNVTSNSPLFVNQYNYAREGADVVLTIDRAVQFTVEESLRRAIENTQAEGGTIIVLDPRTGAIRAMASEPCFDPSNYYDTDPELWANPAVSKVFEPGSVMKLITMAAALDSGTVTPQSTYQDLGELNVGGYKAVNWDRAAHGTVDMTTLLARSLNVGATQLAVWMGPDMFYDYMRAFGFGRKTGIDLEDEVAGLMPLPGESAWLESYLATNSFGQALASTPLQMATAVAAIANDGYLMQPYIVQEVRYANGTQVHEPTVSSQPISTETARQLTAMATTALARETDTALVYGYTIAGKTGTSQIPENGIYDPDDSIATFAGWLPADDPELLIYVKLDRPAGYWGSQTAAPTFSLLAQELVVLLDIPPDNIRLQGDILAARSGDNQ